jgi:hypothetical protein
MNDANARTVLELMSEGSMSEAVAAADSLGSILVILESQALGEFFSGLGLEAAPDEVQIWETVDFLEILLISSDFDSTFAQAEMTDGAWKIDVKNGVFPRMLRDLDMEQYMNP